MANPLLAFLSPKRQIVDDPTDPTSPQTIGVPGSDYGATVPSPDVTGPAGVLARGPGRANDPLATLLLAKSRESELKDRLNNTPVGFDGPDYNRFRDTGLLADVQRDIADDPYTGKAAQAQQAATEKSLNETATFNRPDVTGMRHEQQAAAERLAAAPNVAKGAADLKLQQDRATATARLLQLMGGAPPSQPSSGAPTASAGPGAPGPSANPNQTHFKPAINAKGEVSFSAVEPKPPSVAEQSTLDLAGQIGGPDGLATRFMRQLEAKNPGIDTRPEHYGGVGNALRAKAGLLGYKFGTVHSADDEALNQLTGYLEANLPMLSKSGGRMNLQLYNDLKQHAPQLGLSDGANYLRAKFIVEHILPAVTQGIDIGHGRPATPPAGDLIADPNWGR